MLPTGGMRARFATCSKRRINAGIGNGASEIPDQDAVCLPDGGSVQGELPAADTPPPPRRDGPSRGARVPAGTRSNHRRDRLHPRFSARPAAPCPGLRAGTVACSLDPLRWCDVGTQGTGASRPLWCERPFPPLPPTSVTRWLMLNRRSRRGGAHPGTYGILLVGPSQWFAVGRSRAQARRHALCAGMPRQALH